MIYALISFILEVILSSFISLAYQDINMFFPCIFICSLPLVYHITKRKTVFFTLIIVFGITYDLLFSDIALLNFYYFILFVFFIHISGDYSFIKTIILSIIGTIMYDVYIFFMLIFINYSDFKIEYLYYKLENSVLTNLIYIIISTCILGRLLTDKKKKKRRKKA